MSSTIEQLIEREIKRVESNPDYLCAALQSNFAEGMVAIATVASLITDDQQESFCKRINTAMASKSRKGAA